VWRCIDLLVLSILDLHSSLTDMLHTHSVTHTHARSHALCVTHTRHTHTVIHMHTARVRLFGSSFLRQVSCAQMFLINTRAVQMYSMSTKWGWGGWGGFTQVSTCLLHRQTTQQVVGQLGGHKGRSWGKKAGCRLRLAATLRMEMLTLAKEYDLWFRPARGVRKKHEFPCRGVGSSGGSGSCDRLKQRTR